MKMENEYPDDCFNKTIYLHGIILGQESLVT